MIRFLTGLALSVLAALSLFALGLALVTTIGFVAGALVTLVFAALLMAVLTA